jgi:chromosome segregation ATPase
VRAFRARHRGEEEPATFEESLVDGDDLARAVEHTRQLQADLVAATAALSESNVALQTERRRHQSTLRRLDRARAELDGLRTAGTHREEELELLREGFADLKAENATLRARIALTAPATQPHGPNRAERRRAAKRDRVQGLSHTAGEAHRYVTKRNRAPSG